MNTKLEVGEKFYHSDLNNLIACSDKYFNTCDGEKTYQKHLSNKIKYYVPDNSGRFHTNDYKLENNWKEFIVVESKYGGGGKSYNDIIPDAWQVYCKPVNEENILIKFHQKTVGFAYTIEEVEIIK